MMKQSFKTDLNSAVAEDRRLLVTKVGVEIVIKAFGNASPSRRQD